MLAWFDIPVKTCCATISQRRISKKPISGASFCFPREAKIILSVQRETSMTLLIQIIKGRITQSSIQGSRVLRM
jgi:hypothetical protein